MNGLAVWSYNGEIMNISTNNKNYKEDIYSLPPEPRFVANAVMGWIKNENEA